MGFSDHLAQILWVYIDTCNIELKKVLQRKFSKENVDKFTVMLNNELWEEIYVEKNVNELYQLFISNFLYYFNRAFPLKLTMNNSWISRGIKVSCQKMSFLNNLKQRMSLSRDALSYINRYHRIYKRDISEAEKKDIMTNK
jgi:hypothetical protein